MRPIKKSAKLANVCYDIRGPVLQKAKQMEEEGHKIIKLNIGNLAAFGFDSPEEIQQDIIRNLPNAAGYTDSKGIFAARKAIMHYCQQKQIKGVTLEDKQAINRALLKSGATISEMNCVRRHLSAIKGGRLAAACHPARVVNLLISDVPGDNPIAIASGPTVGDPTSCADALEIVARYGIELPAAARTLLESSAGESIKPGDARLARVTTTLVATPQMALEAAAKVAACAGYTPLLLGDSIEGEARDVGKVMAGIALQARRHRQPVSTPCVLLSGGETTVTVRGSGRGGRNVEFLLSLAVALDGEPGVYAVAGDTDGVDGLEEIAGAFITPTTLKRAWAQGIRPRDSLANNDGHGFFEALGDSLVTGPTLTNVNDFRAIVVL